VLSETPSLVELEDYERMQAAFMERCGGRFTSLSVIRRVTVPGSVEVRDKTKQMTDRFDKHLRASAIVLTASGLAAVLARAFLVGFSLVANPSAPLKTFRTIREGLVWLASVEGQEPGFVASNELISALERFAES
jgi:hypothetical protein